MSLFSKVLGDPHRREISRHLRVVAEINAPLPRGRGDHATASGPLHDRTAEMEDRHLSFPHPMGSSSAAPWSADPAAPCSHPGAARRTPYRSGVLSLS